MKSLPLDPLEMSLKFAGVVSKYFVCGFIYLFFFMCVCVCVNAFVYRALGQIEQGKFLIHVC